MKEFSLDSQFKLPINDTVGLRKKQFMEDLLHIKS